MKDYDVIVIGAGLGGLSAAAFLACAGKRVLLLERHNVPGGYATSFRRGRFEFEVALHMLSGVDAENKRGPVWETLEKCDVARRVEFVPIQDFYRAVFPDLSVKLPIGRQGFEEALSNCFPKEAKNIRNFLSTLFGVSEAINVLMAGGVKTALLRNPLALLRLIRYAKSTVAEVLDRQVSDPRARAVITQTVGFYGLPPSQAPFIVFAAGTADYLDLGPTHIKGRSQALSQAFVDSIEAHGGEVRMNQGAARILVADGRVRGVVTQDGTQISCTHVVSNADILTTCLEMIGRAHLPDWYLKSLARPVGIGTVNVYLGLDCPYTELGIDAQDTFINVAYDSEAQFNLVDRNGKLTPRGIGLSANNVSDPDFSPPGTSVATLIVPSYGADWQGLSPAQYEQAKHDLAEKMIALAERAFPGLREHIEEVEVATPLTNVRFTGNTGGSIYGFGLGAESGLPVRGPLEGLYFSSAWVNMGGGFAPCIMTGSQAASQVIEDMQRGGRDRKTMSNLQWKVAQRAKGAGGKSPLEPGTKHLVSRRHPGGMSLRVMEIHQETPSTKTFRLGMITGELPYFRAGQYITLQTNVDGVLTSRAYSIASPPGKPNYDVTVRRVPGGLVSNYLLDRLSVGDVLKATGPHGTFWYEPLRDTANLVFLAGGSGITSLLSIIQDNLEKKLPVQMHLIYGSRKADNIIFADALKKLAAENDNPSAGSGQALRVDLVISEPEADWEGLRGFLDAEMIASRVGTLAGKTFYVCGPEAMYALCEAALQQLGVPRRRVRREAYGPPGDVTREPGWPEGLSPQAEFEVVEERRGVKFTARAGVPLLSGLEAAGVVVPTVCRSGECSACRTRLLSGKVFAPARAHVRWCDEKTGYIHPCMSYPLENLRIRL